LTLVRAKQILVGTPLGRSLARLRELRALWRVVRSDPEQGGMLCQDVLVRRLLPCLCRPPRIFVDVGAHIGSVIADVRHDRPSMRIVAFEADSDKASKLSRKFPDIEVHGCALGDRDATVTFYIDTKRSGYSSLGRRDRPTTEVREVSVPMRRLDNILTRPADVGLIKLDVEGAELVVLRGASELISRCRPVILFESGPQGGTSLGDSLEDIFDWLVRRDFEIVVPNRVAHNGPGLYRESFVESHYYPPRTLNYFAVPAERRIEVRDWAREAIGVVVHP